MSNGSDYNMKRATLLRERVAADTQRTGLAAGLFVMATLLSPTSARAAAPLFCDSGNPANWLSVPQMTERLTADGWAIDGVVKSNGCWKVTGANPDGKRATGYFHPLSGKKLLVKSGGKVLFHSNP